MSLGRRPVGAVGSAVADPESLLAAWAERLDPSGDATQATADFLSSLAHLVGATRGSLMMINPHTGRLRIMAALGLPVAMVGQDLVPAPRRISDWVLLQRHAVIVNGEIHDQRFEGSAARDHIVSAMSVPLLGMQGPLGVLNLARVSPAAVFDESDLAGVKRLTRQAAVLLERIQETDLVVAGWLRTRGRDREWDLPPAWDGTRRCRVAATRIEGRGFCGDGFERVAHADGGLSLMLFDVFGRGADALQLSGALRGLFLALARVHRSPAEIVHRIHDAVVRHVPGAHAALWIAAVSPNGQLTSCCAGHPPPFCLPTDGATGQRLGAGGPPVGSDLDALVFAEERLRLLPGDAVVAVSDGLLLSADAMGETFGESRVEELMNELRRQPLDQMVERLCRESWRFGRGIAPIDDIIGLALRFTREE